MGNVNVKDYDANMRSGQVQGAGWKWLSPAEPPLQLAGFAWFEQEGVYRRLPEKPQYKLPEAVDMLANCPAGGQIRFQTDSRKLAVRVRLAGPANMVHMPATGQCGFDCYVGPPGEQKFWSVTKYDHTQTDYQCALFTVQERRMRNITLNFPLYQAVKEVQVGIEEGAEIAAPPPFKTKKKLIFYGTSITQGGCASRPGMAYTNIISRRLNVEVINLGFSGSGRGEPELSHIISQIENPGCLVLDYEPNCCGTERLKETLPAFIDIYRRRHPKVPILVVTRIQYSYDIFDPPSLRARKERGAFQRQVVDDRRRAGDDMVYFFDGSTLLGPDFDECTVDGIHPTDLGFLRIADGLTPVVGELIFESDS